MARYVIGDIQGCYTELNRLLERVNFDPAVDYLWLVGDLVNRGHDSLGVLRLLKSMGDRVVCVLGNHDLHLLAVAAGLSKQHRSDTLDEILNAPDREELLLWLRQQHLVYQEDEFVMVHAGLLPQWTPQEAVSLANEVCSVLRSPQYIDFLAQMYGNTPCEWTDDLSQFDRLRVITNACTRMRVCSKKGKMEFKFKGVYQDIPEGYYAWFDLPKRKSCDYTVLFGHWSALGLHIEDNLMALDTGCLWGGQLTAVRLEDRQIFQEPCANPPVQKDW